MDTKSVRGITIEITSRDTHSKERLRKLRRKLRKKILFRRQTSGRGQKKRPQSARDTAGQVLVLFQG